jgi:hypothetical protein
VGSPNQWERPDGRTIRWVTVVWAATTGVAFALLGPSRWRLGLAGEAVTYLALGLVLAFWRPLRQLCAALSPSRRRVPPVLLVVLLLGQLAGGTRLAFPLTRFSMYSDELGSTEVVHTVEAVGRDGERTVVTQPSLFPFWRSYRFTGLVNLIARQEAPIDDGCRGFADLVRLVAELPEWEAPPEEARPARFEVVATTYDLDDSSVRAAGVPSVVRRSVVCVLEVPRTGTPSRPQRLRRREVERRGISALGAFGAGPLGPGFAYRRSLLAVGGSGDGPQFVPPTSPAPPSESSSEP